MRGEEHRGLPSSPWEGVSQVSKSSQSQQYLSSGEERILALPQETSIPNPRVNLAQHQEVHSCCHVLDEEQHGDLAPNFRTKPRLKVFGDCVFKRNSFWKVSTGRETTVPTTRLHGTLTYESFLPSQIHFQIQISMGAHKTLMPTQANSPLLDFSQWFV